MTKADPEADRPSNGPGLLSRRLVVDNIVQAMSDGVMVISAQGEIVLVNPALCRILGLAKRDMLGKGWGELFFEDPRNLDFNQTIIDVVQKRAELYNRQVSYHTPGGQLRELITTTSLLEPGGEVQGLVAVFKDITELSNLHRRQRALLERGQRLAREKIESLDRIARAVAHEVRNPVTAIGGLAARLMKIMQPSAIEANYLSRILQAAGRLEKIVSQVRSYAYLPQPNRQSTDVSAWLKEMLVPYHRQADKNGVNLVLEISPQGADAVIPLDTHTMATALGNLIDNSLEAMAGGGTLQVGLTATDEVLKIIIRDTGPGIPEADLPYLFDPFFTTKADRVGMSLAITKRIITEHDGSLEVESSPDIGTASIISLPRELLG